MNESCQLCVSSIEQQKEDALFHCIKCRDETL